MSLALITRSRFSMCLEMDVPGVRRRGHVFDRAADCAGRARRSTLKPFENMWPMIGVALVDHELHAVRATALIGVADELHVLRVVGLGQVKGSHRVLPPAPGRDQARFCEMRGGVATSPRSGRLAPGVPDLQVGSRCSRSPGRRCSSAPPSNLIFDGRKRCAGAT